MYATDNVQVIIHNFLFRLTFCLLPLFHCCYAIKYYGTKPNLATKCPPFRAINRFSLASGAILATVMAAVDDSCPPYSRTPS